MLLLLLRTGAVAPFASSLTTTLPSTLTSTVAWATSVARTLACIDRNRGLLIIARLWRCRCRSTRALATGTSLAPITLGAHGGGPNPCPHAGFATHQAEQPLAGLLEHFELGVIDIDTESVERHMLGLLDGFGGHFDPFHWTQLPDSEG